MIKWNCTWNLAKKVVKSLEVKKLYFDKKKIENPLLKASKSIKRWYLLMIPWVHWNNNQVQSHVHVQAFRQSWVYESRNAFHLHVREQKELEGNQNKNNCIVSNFYNKLKSPALFSHLFRTEKSAGNFNLV